MATFPKAENDIVALADTMAAGFTAHAADFPSVVPADLTAAITAYKTNRTTQDAAIATAKVATATKDDKLGTLMATMKNCLKLSEVDTAAAPEKLAEIGWGPKAQPQPTVAPGQPLALAAVLEGPGCLTLTWSKPVTGGAVRNYLIQRRDKLSSGAFGPWNMLVSNYTTEQYLQDQPRGIEMEYRIVSSNIAGESDPSNTVVVVL
jgi:hypothetical protein